MLFSNYIEKDLSGENFLGSVRAILYEPVILVWGVHYEFEAHLVLSRCLKKNINIFIISNCFAKSKGPQIIIFMTILCTKDLNSLVLDG